MSIFKRITHTTHFAIFVLLCAVIMPAAASPVGTPPGNGRVLAPGHIPTLCTPADTATSGYFWSESTQRWVSAPLCTPRWGYLQASASQLIHAGDTVTVSAQHDDARIVPWIAIRGGMRWTYPGTRVEGCMATDLYCTVKVGDAAKPSIEWQWGEFHVSGPGRYFILPVSYAPRCQPEDPCLDTQTNAWSWVGIIPAGNQGPLAAMGAPAPFYSGEFMFTSTSTDPNGDALVEEWSFGDGGTGSGRSTNHTYTKPGTYTVTLKVTDPKGLSDTATRKLEVAAPQLGLSLSLLNGAAPPLDPDSPVRAEVKVTASIDGVGPLSGLRFEGAAVRIEPTTAFNVTDGPTPAPNPAGFTLAPGQSTAFVVTLKPVKYGKYTLLSRVVGTDAAARSVQAEASSPGEIGNALTVSISLDPASLKQEETSEGPKPIEVRATVTLKNTSPSTIGHLNLKSLRADRVVVGQPLDIQQTAGVQPDPTAGFPLADLAAGASVQLNATFVAKDDGEIDFSALATGSGPGGESFTGVGKARLSIKPKYLLKFKSKVTKPTAGNLLPAGDPIRIHGEVKNLSNTATLELGPLFPELAGNAGIASVAYDGEGVDPRELAVPPTLKLGPGESKEFTVRLTTSYSDPRGDGVNAHGGTRARVRFTPWGRATLEDGTVVDITPELIDASDDNLLLQVHIDDSIPIPSKELLVIATGFTLGAMEGIWSFASSSLWGIVDLVQMPASLLHAATEYQAQVWEAFTDAEKEAFSADASALIVAVLLKNAEMGKRDLSELPKQVNAALTASMTQLENEWQVGDYGSTVRLYSKFSSEAISNVAVPIALAKLAKSPKAVAALSRAKEALATRMAPVLTEVKTLELIEQVGPILNALENGTELNFDEITRLYGISAEEIAEFQRIATKYKFLLTVRSRHASSLEWIKRGAMVKPEALKIKGVSELDVQLGYPESSLGSLVFKKPVPLSHFDAVGGDFNAAVETFVRSRGFEPGTPDYMNAIKRVGDRAEEWKKYELEYKRMSKRGWIDVSFNYKGNAIDDTVRKGTGSFRGFRLRENGPDEYIVEMLNGKTGRYVPVTGDIDPLAFTHFDGSPLTEAEHADLLDELRKNPLLQTQHPESTTYVKGGVDFVVGQLKPGEPALQIAPGGLAPRVVRINKAQSGWLGPRDYHLWWDGGWTDAGANPVRAYLPFTRPDFGKIAAEVSAAAAVDRPRAIPGAGKKNAALPKAAITVKVH